MAGTVPITLGYRCRLTGETHVIAQFVVAATLSAAPDISKYGYFDAAVKDAVLLGALSSDLPLVSATPTVKALPKTARAAAAVALASFVKSWVMSEEFSRAYAQALKDRRLPVPAPRRTRAQLLKVKRMELERSIQEMFAASAGLPKSAQESTQLAAKELRRATEAQWQDGAVLELEEDERFNLERAAYERNLLEFPDDVRASIKRTLDLFLEQTRDIDYSAALKEDEGGKKVFVSETYEARGRTWKMGFRAGREATEAAREFVARWRKELSAP